MHSRIILNPTPAHLASRSPDTIRDTAVWSIAEAREEGKLARGTRYLEQDARGAWVLRVHA